MFDVGFWELALIGIVALIIIGPERLPGAAHTVGLWVGKARRMLRDAKADLDREIREQNITAIKDEMQGAGAEFKAQVDADLADVSNAAKQANEWKDSLTDVSPVSDKKSGKAVAKKSAKKASKKKSKKKSKKQNAAGSAYFIYESKTGQHKAVLHKGYCAFCRQGSGRAGSAQKGKWHGPFANLAIARRRQKALNAKVEKECGTCIVRKS